MVPQIGAAPEAKIDFFAEQLMQAGIRADPKLIARVFIDHIHAVAGKTRGIMRRALR